MLFRCCLLQIAMIELRHNLYLVYLCPCLGLGLFISYICNVFCKLIFNVINHVISFKPHGVT